MLSDKSMIWSTVAGGAPCTASASGAPDTATFAPICLAPSPCLPFSTHLTLQTWNPTPLAPHLPTPPYRDYPAPVTLSPEFSQDIFDAGLVMGETDFSRLSYRHAGQLPGIDIAYLADGAAYHTTRDTMQRLRVGVLQVGEGEGSTSPRPPCLSIAAVDGQG